MCQRSSQEAGVTQEELQRFTAQVGESVDSKRVERRTQKSSNNVIFLLLHKIEIKLAPLILYDMWKSLSCIFLQCTVSALMMTVSTWAVGTWTVGSVHWSDFTNICFYAASLVTLTFSTSCYS